MSNRFLNKLKISKLFFFHFKMNNSLYPMELWKHNRSYKWILFDGLILFKSGRNVIETVVKDGNVDRCSNTGRGGSHFTLAIKLSKNAGFSFFFSKYEQIIGLARFFCIGTAKRLQKENSEYKPAVLPILIVAEVLDECTYASILHPFTRNIGNTCLFPAQSEEIKIGLLFYAPSRYNDK